MWIDEKKYEVKYKKSAPTDLMRTVNEWARSVCSSRFCEWWWWRWRRQRYYWKWEKCRKNFRAKNNRNQVDRYRWNLIGTSFRSITDSIKKPTTSPAQRQPQLNIKIQWKSKREKKRKWSHTIRSKSAPFALFHSSKCIHSAHFFWYSQSNPWKKFDEKEKKNELSHNLTFSFLRFSLFFCFVLWTNKYFGPVIIKEHFNSSSTSNETVGKQANHKQTNRKPIIKKKSPTELTIELKTKRKIRGKICH